MKIRPLKGYNIPNPFNNYAIVPPEGIDVEDHVFWQRLIRDGDVEVVGGEQKASKNTKQKDAE